MNIKYKNKKWSYKITKHIWCDYKYKLNSKTFNSNQKWNNKTGQCEYKNYCTYKKDYSWNASTCIWVNSKYSESIADTSVLQLSDVMKLYLL